MRAAICDDRAEDAQLVAQYVRAWGESRGESVALEMFPSAEAFLFAYDEDKNFDLLLLDVEMGGMDGVTMAKRVRAENTAVQIVFITGYTDYIAERFLHGVIAFCVYGRVVFLHIEITDFVERHADGLAAAFERERAAI